MKKNSHHNRKDFFYRRFFILIFLKVSFFVVILVRLFILQIVQFSKYKRIATNNAKKLAYISQKRGNIFDRNNFQITDNQTYFEARFMRLTKNYETILDEVFAILKNRNFTDKFITKIKKEVKKKNKNSIRLCKNLTRSELVNLEFNLSQLPGLEISNFQSRLYPLKEKAAHVLGYIFGESNNYKLNMKKISKDENYKSGQFGLESYFNDILSGSPGIKEITINALGDKITEKILEESKNGQDIKVSLDSDLQTYAADLMGNDVNGSINLMNLKDSSILAMYSNPSFDPNKFVKGFDNYEDEFDFSKKEPLFFNKSISITYPPGSPFKIISSLALLEGGLNPYEIYKCTGKHKIGNRYFHCWKESGHGNMNLFSAIAHSCSCYFFAMSNRIKFEKLNDIARIFGFEELTKIELFQEKKGTLPTKELKLQNYNESNLMLGDLANSVIGQGLVSATPIQLLTMIARVATGKKIYPTLLLNKKNYNNYDIPINSNHLKIVRTGLYDVFHNGGVLSNKIPKNSPYYFAGKTGTAQVISRRIKNEDMNNIKYQNRTHSIFTGYVPFDDPKLAISVVADHSLYGAGKATNIALKLLNKALEKDYIKE